MNIPGLLWRSARVIFVGLFFAGLVFVSGCGGSSGGNNGLSPEELEVATVLDAFAAAVSEENSGQAMSYVDTNLVYWGAANPQDYSAFETRLQNFFAISSTVKMMVSGAGITLTSDTLASVRGLLELEYTSNGTGLPVLLVENVELKMAKTGKNWGIIEFAKYGNAGTTITSFPPQN